MNGPTRDGPSLDLEATRTATATTAADRSGGGRGEPASEERPTGDLRPTSGRLLWIPPDGQAREITRSSLRAADEAVHDGETAHDGEEMRDGDVTRDDGAARDPEGTRRCSACGAARSVETIVREHEACGYVGLGGFVDGEGRGYFVCPKCDRVPGDERATADGGDERATADGSDERAAADGDERGTGTDGGEVDGPASPGAVDDAFPPVSTVHSCLGCGRILDRPLGGDGSDD